MKLGPKYEQEKETCKLHACYSHWEGVLTEWLSLMDSAVHRASTDLKEQTQRTGHRKTKAINHHDQPHDGTRIFTFQPRAHPCVPKSIPNAPNL